MAIGKFFSKKQYVIDYASASFTGTRKRNEDSVLAIGGEGRHCFVVADGLGGMGLGDVASQTLVEVFKREFDAAVKPKQFLIHAFNKAQEEICAIQEKAGKTNQMRTTAVALVEINSKLAWGYIGDSRLYRFADGIFIERTSDHSVPQMLLKSGQIKEEDIATHPDRSRLLRSMGDKWTKPRYEVSKEISLRHNAQFLLCSDGIWEIVPQNELVPKLDAQTWLDGIISNIQKAEQGGADCDNYSAVTVVVR